MITGSQQTMGIEVKESGSSKGYNLKPGLNQARLVEIKEHERETFKSRTNPDPHPVEKEPTFCFLYQVRDLDGTLVILERQITKKITFTKIQSNLYKDIQILCPDKSKATYQSPEGVASCIVELAKRITDKDYPAVLLNVDKTNSGYLKIESIHAPMGQGKLSSQIPMPAIKEIDDDIPF